MNNELETKWESITATKSIYPTGIYPKKISEILSGLQPNPSPAPIKVTAPRANLLRMKQRYTGGKGKGKTVYVQTMKVYEGSCGVAPFFLNLSTI
jgi:hypothetical protein